MRAAWAAFPVVAALAAMTVTPTPALPGLAMPSQQAADGPADLAELENTGAAITWVADGVIPTSSPDPILALDRIFLGAGARFDVETFAPSLLYVEHGPVALGSATGGMTTFGSGKGLARDDIRQLVVENQTRDCASLLRLVVASAQATAQDDAISAPTLPSCDTETEHLWGTPMLAIGVEGMPMPYGRAYLAEAIWPAAQGTGDVLSLDGPMAILVEDGALALTSPDSGESRRVEDAGALLLAGSRWQVANPGPGSARALVAGVVPAAAEDLVGLPGGRYQSPTYGYALAWGGDWYALQDGAEAGHDHFGLASYRSSGSVHFEGMPAPAGGAAECLAAIAPPGAQGTPLDRDDVRQALGFEPGAFAGNEDFGFAIFHGCVTLGDAAVGITWFTPVEAIEAALPDVATVIAALSPPE